MGCAENRRLPQARTVVNASVDARREDKRSSAGAEEADVVGRPSASVLPKTGDASSRPRPGRRRGKNGVKNSIVFVAATSCPKGAQAADDKDVKAATKNYYKEKTGPEGRDSLHKVKLSSEKTKDENGGENQGVASAGNCDDQKKSKSLDPGARREHRQGEMVACMFSSDKNKGRRCSPSRNKPQPKNCALSVQYGVCPDCIQKPGLLPDPIQPRLLRGPFKPSVYPDSVLPRFYPDSLLPRAFPECSQQPGLLPDPIQPRLLRGRPGPSFYPESILPSVYPDSVLPRAFPDCSQKPGLLLDPIQPGLLPDPIQPRLLRGPFQRSFYPESVLPSVYPDSVLPRVYPDGILPRAYPESVLPRVYPDSLLPRVYPDTTQLSHLSLAQLPQRQKACYRSRPAQSQVSGRTIPSRIAISPSPAPSRPSPGSSCERSASEAVAGAAPINRKMWGRFECEFCHNHWRSVHAWYDMAQVCQLCLESGYLQYVYPYLIEEIRWDRPHNRDGCDACQQLGYSCTAIDVMPISMGWIRKMKAEREHQDQLRRRGEVPPGSPEFQEYQLRVKERQQPKRRGGGRR